MRLTEALQAHQVVHVAADWIGLPLAATMTSPTRMPALSAGDPVSIWVTIKPLFALNTEGLCQLRGHVLALRAETPALDFTVIDQLAHDAAREVDRDGKADADIALCCQRRKSRY